jgi:hypothetical protein
LSWIAPGDDVYTDNISNGLYKIKYSTYVSDNTGFWTSVGDWTDYKNKFALEWSTNTAQSNMETRTITSLLSGVTYYVRIWTQDEYANNWSEMSVGATAWAQVAIVSAELINTTDYIIGELQTNISTVCTTGTVIRNSGNVKLTYSLAITTGAPFTVWSASTTPGVDMFTAYGLFKDVQPAETDFIDTSEGNDVLTVWNIKSSNTNFSDGTKTGVGVEPFIVKPLLSDCTVWMKLKTATATTTAEQQKIRLIITFEEEE